MTLEEEHFKDGEIRVNCKGTIRAEFWKKDVENVLFNDQKGFLKVLEVKESQWPSKCHFWWFRMLLLFSDAVYKISILVAYSISTLSIHAFSCHFWS